MKKNMKLAWKRFLVLFICLLLIFPLLVGIKEVSKETKIIIGILFLALMVIYWLYAIISIRRDNQKKSNVRKSDKKHD